MKKKQTATYPTADEARKQVADAIRKTYPDFDHCLLWDFAVMIRDQFEGAEGINQVMVESLARVLADGEYTDDCMPDRKELAKLLAGTISMHAPGQIRSACHGWDMKLDCPTAKEAAELVSGAQIVNVLQFTLEPRDGKVFHHRCNEIRHDGRDVTLSVVQGTPKDEVLIVLAKIMVAVAMFWDEAITGRANGFKIEGKNSMATRPEKE